MGHQEVRMPEQVSSESLLVFIGRNLPGKKIAERFESCAA